MQRCAFDVLGTAREPPIAFPWLATASRYISSMHDTPASWNPELATRQTRCERCGTDFGCRNLGEEGSCWCSREQFKLPIPLPEGVGPYSECLCPGCLRAVAAELRDAR